MGARSRFPQDASFQEEATEKLKGDSIYYATIQKLPRRTVHGAVSFGCPFFDSMQRMG